MWDIHVPRVHHYIAQGAVHGNSGKSKLGCRESIRFAIAYPGSRNLVARLAATDLRKTTKVTFRRELGEIGLARGRDWSFNKNSGELEWRNGSVTIFTHLEDGEALGSMELSSAFVDEGSEVPDGIYQLLFPARLRWHLPGCELGPQVSAMIARGEDPSGLSCPCPRRAWICTNPGASGYLRGVTKGFMPEGAGGWEHFAVPPAENPYNGPDYYRELADLGARYGPHWFARFYKGDWDSFEGQRFPMLERSRHVLAADFRPGAEHEVFEGYDFGFRNPTAVLWIAAQRRREHPPIVFCEYEAAEREIPDHARAIKEIRAGYGLTQRDVQSFGDPAGSQRRGSGMSDIMLYASHGIEIVPCHIGKMPGPRADLVALMLSASVATRDGLMAGLSLNPRCPRLTQALIDYRFKDGSSRMGEDPRESFHKHNDHLVDALGYALAAMPREATEEFVTGSAPRDDPLGAQRAPTVAELDAAIGEPARPVEDETVGVWGGV